MRTHPAVRHAFAVIMGLVCVYMFFMGGGPVRLWLQWVPFSYRQTIIAAVLFLPCRFLGRLTVGLMVSYCAPVSLLMFVFMLGEGLIGPKLEPLFAVFAGGFCSFALTRVFEWLNERAGRARHRQEI